MVCIEQTLVDTDEPAHALSIVSVVPFPRDEDCEWEGAHDPHPEHALRAAYALLTHVRDHHPEAFERSPIPTLIGAEVYGVTLRMIADDVAKGAGESKLLRQVREGMRWEREEQLTVSRLTGRRVGLQDARSLIRDLHAAAAEPHDMTRAVLLQGLTNSINEAIR
jgi:hypothetical protein